MADVTLVADGEGALRCVVCNLSGITDAVAHADWHDEYDRRLLDKGFDAGWASCQVMWSSVGTELALTATERQGCRKYSEHLGRMHEPANRQAAWAALQSRWADV